MIELLAPAGDLEKLKTALDYGADAVFVGGQDFSLRARASNFTISDIKEATDYAHNLGKKVYVTTNIIPHEEDLANLIPYLKSLEEAKVDAIITASPYIINSAINNTNLEVHLSTQQTTTNLEAISYWQEKGVKRIVLARELSIDEISNITANTTADIEVFIHGGMCMSFSGRCSLSNTMTNRDANRGGCAHSCRWNYVLQEDNKIISDSKFSMSSKDLEATAFITKMIDANVKSLKIEGRMKSLHYIATVVGTYRKLIDEYVATKKVEDLNYYQDEIKKAENRLTSHGFLKGEPTINEQLFNQRSETPTKLFVGLVKEFDETTNIAVIEQRNYFEINDNLEVYMPSGKIKPFKLTSLKDEEDNEIAVARHPKQILKIKIPFKVEKGSMIRKL